MFPEVNQNYRREVGKSFVEAVLSTHHSRTSPDIHFFNSMINGVPGL